jgi:hypothetical protein
MDAMFEPNHNATLGAALRGHTTRLLRHSGARARACASDGRSADNCNIRGRHNLHQEITDIQ